LDHLVLYRLQDDQSLKLDSLHLPPRKALYLVICSTRTIGMPRSSCQLNVLVLPVHELRIGRGIARPVEAILSSSGESSRLSAPVPFEPLPLPAAANIMPTATPSGPLLGLLSALDPFHQRLKLCHAKPSATQIAFAMSLRSMASRTARQVPRRGACWSCM
jgi:hypothetical protein